MKALDNVQSYSKRVLSATFCGNPATTVVVAYSLTNVSTESDLELFYDHLRSAIQDTPRLNFLVVLGDFNVRFGPNDVLFPFHSSINRNGGFLRELVEEYNLLGQQCSERGAIQQLYWYWFRPPCSHYEDSS